MDATHGVSRPYQQKEFDMSIPQKFLKLWNTCTGEGRLREATADDIAKYDALSATAFANLEFDISVDGTAFGYPGQRVYVVCDQRVPVSAEEHYDY